MLILYKNYQQTEENTEQSLGNVNQARRTNEQAYISLQRLFEKNDILQFEEIRPEQHLKLMFIITDEMLKLHKNWPHLHEFLLIFSRQIEFMNSNSDNQMNFIHQLCQRLDISLKFMIEQLNMNKNYFLLKTNQNRIDHLSKLDLQKINRTQLISSSYESINQNQM
jgi:hypothetical protein